MRRLWGSHDDEPPDQRRPPTPSRRCRNGRRDRVFALPDYVEVEPQGPDHAPRFTSEVRIDGCAPARGEGASKRAAEQAAATALLEREGVAGAELHE